MTTEQVTVTNQEDKKVGFCLHCRHSAVGNFCWKCGSLLIDVFSFAMECECRSAILPWAYYCNNCGKRIAEESIYSYLEDKGCV